MDKNSGAQGGEGNIRFRPYPEPGETLTQLGQPTQLDQHRDIGMKHSSFHCCFIGMGLRNRNRFRNRKHFSWLFTPDAFFFRSNERLLFGN